MAKRSPIQRIALAAKLARARGNQGTGRELSADENPKTKLAQNAGKISAGSTQGLGPSGFTGGGGGVAAPVSTLAGLPQSPLLDTLIKNGLITEGMPPEQALAVLKFAQMREGVPINVAELMKLVSSDYAKTSGDILTSGQDWMNQLMGTAYDPNDPNARLFADDPIFSEYAGGMAQLDEVADLNEASDLAWFRKNQEAQEQYYGDMMTAISTGTLPVGAAATGGGGGGGGGGGRGYGGGGGSGGGDSEWGDTKVVNKHDESVVNQEVDKRYWNFPGFRENFLAAVPRIAAEQGITDPVMLAKIMDRAESIINIEGSKPQDVLAAVEEEILDIDTKTTARNDIEASNAAWMPTAPGRLDQMLRDYQAMTGLQLGDDPNTPMEDTFSWVPPVDNPDTEVDESEALPPVLDAYNSQKAGELRSFLDNAIIQATGGNVDSPEQVSQAVNLIGYIQGLAQQRLAENPEEFQNASLADSMVSRNPVSASATNTSAPVTTTTPSGTRYEVLPTNQQADMTDEQLAQILPQMAGQQNNPGAATGHPPPLDMGQFDAATQAGTFQADPLAAGLSPTQRYQASGLSSDDIVSKIQDALARNKWSNQPPSIADQNGPYTNEDFGGGDFPAPQYANRQEWEAAQGQPSASNGLPGVDFEAGSPMSQLGVGVTTMTNPVMQALAQMRLNTPQVPPPLTPTGNMSITDKMNIASPEVLAAAAKARTEKLVERLKDWGYTEEGALDPANAITNPDAIRQEYTRRLAYEKPTTSWGGIPKLPTLTDPFQHAVQEKSYSDFRNQYPNYNPEELAGAYNEGEYWQPQTVWNEDEYKENQAVAELLPMLQDFINRPGGENPDAGPATVYSSGTDTVRQSDAQNASTTAYVPPEEGLPDIIPFDETSPIEDYEEPDTTLSLGGYAGQSIPLPAGARSISSIKRPQLDIPTMLAKSAQNILAARSQPTSKPSTGGSWGGGRKPAYKSTTKSNVNKAANAVKLAKIASVLSGFKKMKR